MSGSRLAWLHTNIYELYVSTRARARAFIAAVVVTIATAWAIEEYGVWYYLSHSQAVGKTSAWTTLPIRVAQARAMDADVVLLVGGSTSRELSPSDTYMSRRLTDICGQPIRFINGGTSNQVFAEAWSIAEAVPAERLKLIVVGMNPLRFEEGYEAVSRSFNGRRMVFPGPAALHDILSSHGHKPETLFPPMANTAWAWRNASQLEWRKAPSFEEFLREDQDADPFQAREHVYVTPILTDRRKQELVGQMVSERLSYYDRYEQQGQELWSEFIRRFGTESRKVLFLALPESQFLHPLHRIAGAAYARNLEALRAEGAAVEEVATANRLIEEDFYDQQHLVRAGRLKLVDGLIFQIADHFPSCNRAAHS